MQWRICRLQEWRLLRLSTRWNGWARHVGVFEHFGSKEEIHMRPTVEKWLCHPITMDLCITGQRRDHRLSRWKRWIRARHDSRTKWGQQLDDMTSWPNLSFGTTAAKQLTFFLSHPGTTPRTPNDEEDESDLTMQSIKRPSCIQSTTKLTSESVSSIAHSKMEMHWPIHRTFDGITDLHVFSVANKRMLCRQRKAWMSCFRSVLIEGSNSITRKKEKNQFVFGNPCCINSARKCNLTGNIDSYSYNFIFILSSLYHLLHVPATPKQTSQGKPRKRYLGCLLSLSLRFKEI